MQIVMPEGMPAFTKGAIYSDMMKNRLSEYDEEVTIRIQDCGNIHRGDEESISRPVRSGGSGRSGKGSV